jgi:hypothetical protein
MKDEDRISVVLGDEYDDQLRVELFRVLAELGATPLCTGSWSLGGSQELSEIDVILDGSTVHVESETYIGLSVAGPPEVVAHIQKLMT